MAKAGAYVTNKLTRDVMSYVAARSQRARSIFRKRGNELGMQLGDVWHEECDPNTEDQCNE